MEINWSIAGWIIFALVLYTIGFYEGRSNGYKRRKREEEQEKIKTPAAPPQADDPGMLRLKNETGTTTLDLDGARVDTSSLSSDQRKRLTDLVMQMRPWLKDETSAAPTMTPPPLPPQPPSDPAQSASSALPPISWKPASPSKETSAKKDERPAPPPTSIVGQIDLILQEKLIGSPLADKGLSLSQSPEGGVIVNIGPSKYSGVDEVPDAEIKSFIRAAIAAWEKKYTPGL
ncbi:MAG: hypothetical protein IT314_02060 [Anaerolineales bacterium]|nr:hypothetical protein [Anaerolineales bacterium]